MIKKVKGRLLLVEDYAQQRKLLHKQLEKGFDDVRCATQIREAKYAIAAGLDFAVCDIRLDHSADNEDGLGLIQEIRHRHPSSKIVACSEHAELEARALNAGADAFVAKSTGGGSLARDMKATALEVEMVLERLRTESGEPFSHYPTRHAIGYVLMWIILPFFAALCATVALLFTGYHPWFVSSTAATWWPAALCGLFLATLSAARGRRDPVISTWGTFQILDRWRREIAAAIPAALLIDIIRLILERW